MIGKIEQVEFDPIFRDVADKWDNGEEYHLWEEIPANSILLDLFKILNHPPELLVRDYNGRVKIFCADERLNRTIHSKENAFNLMPCSSTLYLIDYNEYNERVSDWLVEFRKVTGLNDIVVSLFLAYPGSGLPLHWDAVNNITCQLSGEKTWYVQPNIYYPKPEFNYAPNVDKCFDGVISGEIEKEILTGSDDQIEITLKEGAMIFVPRGLLHRTKVHNLSLSVSITIKPLLYGSEICRALSRKLLVEEIFREDMNQLNMPIEGHLGEKYLEELAHSINKELMEKRNGNT